MCWPSVLEIAPVRCSMEAKWRSRGIDDGNDLIQEGFRSFVGSGHELIGELHGRVGAGKFVAVDAV